jgi:CHAT domain-containing protein
LVHKIFHLALLTLVLLASIAAASLPATRGQAVLRAASGSRQDAEALYSRAVQLAQTGHYGPAVEGLFAAVQIWLQAGQQDRAIVGLSEMGDFYSKRGYWQEAIRCYSPLLQYQSVPEKTRALTCNSLAAAMTCLRQFDLATSHYQEAQAIAKQIKDRLIESQALTGLASVAFEKDQLPDASRLLKNALKLQEFEKNERAQAETLRLIGRIHERQGSAAVARSTYEQALALYRNASDSQDDQAQLLCLLSHLALVAGQKQEASDRAIEAVKLTTIKSGDVRWCAHLALARAQRALGQLEDARKSYIRAMTMVEKQMLSLTADALRIAYMEDRQAPYREGADTLIRLGRLEEAFELSERARARGMLNLLGEGAQAERKEITPEQLKSLEAANQAIKESSLKLNSDALSDAERQAAQTQLQQAKQRREQIWLEMQMARRSRYVSPASLHQVQASLLGSNATLIEFTLGDEQSCAWLVSATDLRCVALPAKREIEQKVTEFLNATTTKPSSLTLKRALAHHLELAGQVFEMLLGQFRPQLQTGHRLLIAPDGILHYVPFGALASGNRYLIEDNEIVYTPSASVFCLLTEPRAGPDASEQLDLLAIGDPAFDLQPSAMGPLAGVSLPRLLKTRDEVQGIGELFPAARRTIYLDQQATEEALKREPLRRYQRIHFATHSIIDERYPARSGMVLTRDKNGQEDGVLTVDEIAQLELHCRLVVLSACQTGRGRLAVGEGMVGLARAFLYAGAQSVAVTLWNVSDISTETFMKGFYRQQAAGANPLAALREAKLELLHSKTVTRHPYYWAPFVLVGNPN